MAIFVETVLRMHLPLFSNKNWTEIQSELIPIFISYQQCVAQPFTGLAALF
jgi:hypothetical protein